MNRHYDFEKYIDILEYIREKMPDCTVSSDIIVGFPTEGDEDFEDTLKALERARFDMIFSFQYSPRKGTPAAEMEQIPQEIKQARFDRMLALQNSICLEQNKRVEGKVLRVLCEGASKNNADTFFGRTEGGKIVFFAPCPENIGKFVNVEIERGDTFALYGKII
jgi:tRNA-2-methylthio-N6-dimethylallyladenosine synthase